MARPGDGLKVALVHDWLVGNAGGERVLFDMHKIWPDAPIYTLVYDEERAPEWTRSCDVRTTRLQRMPGAKQHHKVMLSFMPRAWEELDLTEFDLVVSSCMSCCKGIITRPDALHVCYCHSPIRYVWDLYYDYLRDTDPLRRVAMKRIIPRIRQWDFSAAQRVDYFVANSEYVARRIRKYYRREAKVIHPASPVRAKTILDARGYYLVVSRFVRYKRVDIAIAACNALGRRLKVVGSGGEEEEALREMAGPTVEFIGYVSDSDMADLYAGANALLFPGVEDFGLTPVESMSFGSPVLAYGRGGALETVDDGRVGLLFDEQTPESLVECIERLEREGVAYTREQIHEYAAKFSCERFRDELGAFVQEKLLCEGII